MSTFAGGMLGASGCFLGAGTGAGSGAGLSYFSGCAGTSAGFSSFSCSDRQHNSQQLLEQNSASAPYPQSSPPFTIRNTSRHACGAASESIAKHSQYPLSHYYTSSQSIVPLLTLGVLC